MNRASRRRLGFYLPVNTERRMPQPPRYARRHIAVLEAGVTLTRRVRKARARIMRIAKQWIKTP